VKKGEKVLQPQPAPAQPAAAPTPLARPFGGRAGEAAAGGKPAGGADWPMYGGCEARCGRQVDLQLPIKEAWKFEAGSKVRSGPVVAGGIVYVGSDGGSLFALDLAAGGKKWEAKPGSRVRCSPAVAKGIVVCGADDGVMRAFDAATGEAKWEFKTGGPITASPAIVGERVVFGSWDGHCYCVRLTDGREFWRYRVGDVGVRVYSPPAVAAGRVYIGVLEDFQIHALDLGTGKPLAGYDRNVPSRATKSPRLGSIHGLAVYRGAVATTRRGGVGNLLDAASGKLLAQFGTRCSALFSLPVFDGDQVYHPCAPRGMKLPSEPVKPSTEKRPPYFRKSALNAPLVGGGLMIIATEVGTLEAYRLGGDAQTPAWEWKSKSGAEIHTAPAAAGGFIVVGSDDGHVYAFTHTKGAAKK
jgi:outer membrane protein assembly factor BamB